MRPVARFPRGDQDAQERLHDGRHRAEGVQLRDVHLVPSGAPEHRAVPGRGVQGWAAADHGLRADGRRVAAAEAAGAAVVGQEDGLRSRVQDREQHRGGAQLHALQATLRRHPPRHQAREHPAHRQRRRQGCGLWPLQDVRHHHASRARPGRRGRSPLAVLPAHHGEEVRGVRREGVLATVQPRVPDDRGDGCVQVHGARGFQARVLRSQVRRVLLRHGGVRTVRGFAGVR